MSLTDYDLDTIFEDLDCADLTVPEEEFVEECLAVLDAGDDLTDDEINSLEELHEEVLGRP